MSLSALPPSASPQALGLDPQALARIGRVLQAEIDAQRLPGAVALVLRRGRLALFEAWGRRDPAASDPMTRDAVFRIYSMTKPLVSVAALMLMEEGRLLLSDPLRAYLPEFASPRVGVPGVPAQAEITLHDLLRHTAGMGYEFIGSGPVQSAYVQAAIGARTRDNATFARTLAALPLLREPGTAWAYSRATDVLGRVVELVSGQGLGEVLRERLFEPLGMVDTGFHVAQAHHGRIAEPHARDPVSGEAVRLFDPRLAPAFESGGGGLVSTAVDYARFLQLMLGGGRLEDLRLLGRKTVALMTSDHLGGLPRSDDLLPAGHGFGLGVAVRLADGLAPLAGSAGLYYWGGIAGTTFFVDPREELAALLMIQAPGQRDRYRTLFRNLVYACIDD